MSNLTPNLIAVAEQLGIDLVGGEHDPMVAEAARRTNLELLAFPRWTWSEIQTLVDSLKELAAEEQRAVDQYTRVMAAMQQHDVGTVGGVPRAELCRIFECQDGVLDAVMGAAFQSRWWHHRR